MRLTRGPGWSVLSLVLVLSACNSDRPESAEADLPTVGLRLSLTRTATHPFLARYRMTLQVEGSEGCKPMADLFPDTGYVGRRNVYHQDSGSVTVVGQYDARLFDRRDCTIRLVEFRSLVGQAIFLGAFDTDSQKRWRFLPASERPERIFEKQ